MKRFANGGTTAQRAVLRWGWRLFRAEWRQQMMLLALLGVAVATATFAAAFAYNVTPDPAGAFGSAGYSITFDGSDATATETVLVAARERFGTIDVVTTREVRVAGSVEPVTFRAQDPAGPYGAPMLALNKGRYPRTPGEVAVTDQLAQTFEVTVGATLALGGSSRRVVGLVENPHDLADEFALVPPNDTVASATSRILVRADDAGVEAFRQAVGGAGGVFTQSRYDDRTLAAVGTFMLAVVGLMLVALIAAAGFVVVAQRRLRQLGMLAAIGATARHVRLVTLVNGSLVGVIAAGAGTTTGLAAWLAAQGRVEEAAGHRIGGLSVPWWLIGVSILLAVATATGAAWWPARSVARIPIMAALSTRPPRPRSAHRPALLAVLLVVAGLAAFALADRDDAVLLVAGTVTVAVGVLMTAPAAIRVVAASAARLPVAARLALRDLGRYQARSGAAVAAITMAVGLPVAVIVVAAAAEHGAGEGNLADRQLLIRVNDSPYPSVVQVRSPSEVDALDDKVDRLASRLDHPEVLALDAVLDLGVAAPNSSFVEGGRRAVALSWRAPDAEHAEIELAYLATPQVLERFASGVAGPASGSVYAVHTEGSVRLFSTKTNSTPVTDLVRLPDPGYSSLPRAFIGTETARARGWEPTRVGWLIETASALTAEERAAARDLAAEAGLTIEARDQQSSLRDLRSGATAAGILLALGVLAMTVGLIRSETAGELRILVATGASSTIRRNLAAATAGALALIGVFLGTAGAYVVLVGAYLGELDNLSPVPVLPLAALAAGVPLLASVGAWLLAGREPASIIRPVFE